MRHRHRAFPLAGAAVILAGGCATPGEQASTSPATPQWSFDSTMIFPVDGSLSRPEDGVLLADGRLVVADQVFGLRLVHANGRSEPFGQMPAAGYRHAAPPHVGGANGVSLEPGGTHLLVADVFGGALFRVEVASGATERIYQHRYGINAAIRDARGGIWFTQSAHNTPEEGEPRLWAAVDRAVPEGAVYHLAMTGDRAAGEAHRVADSLMFANGLALDESAGHLYVAEIGASRVLRFRADLATGVLTGRTVFADSIGADNLELDRHGRLWMAVPVMNALMMVETATGARHVAFQELSPAQAEVVAEIGRRIAAGEGILSAITPALWAPLPGLITGVILRPDGTPAYLTSLGNALVRLP